MLEPFVISLAFPSLKAINPKPLAISVSPPRAYTFDMGRFKVKVLDKNTLNLTLSVLLEFDERMLKEVLSLQDRALHEVHYSSLLNESTIYRYPISTFHFSIINFATCNGFLADHTRLEFEIKYRELIRKLLEEIPKYLVIFKTWELKIDRLYPYSDGSKPSDSIAANIFLPKRKLSQLKIDLRALVEYSLVPNDDERLKAYEDDKGLYFPINLVRFFRELSKQENSVLTEGIDDINDGFKKRRAEKLKLKRLSLVVSDNYLSNQAPEIAHFLLD